MEATANEQGSEVSGEQGVTYTVKELIGMLERSLTAEMGRIVTRLDSIDKKLDEKATNVRVEALESRATATEERVGKLEIASAGTAAVSKFQRWAVGAAAVWASIAIGLLAWISSGGHA